MPIIYLFTQTTQHTSQQRGIVRFQMRAKFIDYAKKLCKWSNLEISYGLLMPHEMLSQFELVFSPSRFTHTFTNSKTALVQQNMQTRTLSGLLYYASCHHRPMAWERSGVQAVRPVFLGKRGCFTCARSSLLARRLNTPAPILPHQYTFKLSKFQLRCNSNLYSFRLWTSHLNPPLLHAFYRFTLVVCCRCCCCSNCGFLRNRWNSRLVIIIDDGCIRRIY